jgi:potassium/hydrogen antiporter
MSMAATAEQILAAAGLLLLISILASKTAGRLGIPALVLFLFVGMLAGSEGPGGISYDDPSSAQFLGVIALVLILFSGGLDTRWADVRAALLPGVLLATVGVAATAGVMGLFLHYVMGLPWLFSLLFGAVVSSTDAAAVFAVLRSRDIGLKSRLRALLELESGSNDPMAVILTLGITGLIVSPATRWSGFGLELLLQLVLGVLIGFAAGRAGVWLVNRINLPYDGLYPVLSLALALAIYGVTSLGQGNGFLAAYIAGLVFANARFIHKATVTRFHDGLAWLMQITMFLVLGLLVFPSQLLPVASLGLAASACLIFIARPLAVFLCLTPLRVPWREQVLVSWVGLRGAVPIILATFPLLAGVDGAPMLFNVVFFVVMTSVLIQGPTISLVARILKLDEPYRKQTAYPLVFEPSSSTTSELFEVIVPGRSNVEGKRIVDLALPENTLIVLVNRGEHFVVPHGHFQLKASDKLLVLAEKGKAPDIRHLVETLVPAARPDD